MNATKVSLTFADVTEPDVLEGTGTLAVNTFKSVGSDDDVAQSSSVLEDKDSVGRSSVLVRVAGVATVKLLVAIVLHSRDDADGREGHDTARARGDVEGLGGTEGGKDSSRQGSDLELHFLGDEKTGGKRG